MPDIKPFKGLRPPQHLVEEVQCKPYDVLNSEEAKQEAEDNEKSLYHIIKPEINFPNLLDEYNEEVYKSGAEELKKFQEKGWLQQDDDENYYMYAQTMNGHTQYGLVVCCHIDDYINGVIKKHELTRSDKEDDRMRHIRITNANVEPVFLAFRNSAQLLEIMNYYASTRPIYDFVAKTDGFRHRFWIISDKKHQEQITKSFKELDALYIADGHHRSAAAVRVGIEKTRKQKKGDSIEDFYYMAVCFPAEQLTVMDYNRVIKDLNGMTSSVFLNLLEHDFIVEKKGTSNYAPKKLHEFSLYIEGQWYSLNAKENSFNKDSLIESLDVDICSKLILEKLLAIKDLRRDKRVDFVGGLRGLDELKKRVDSGKMVAALALYPVTMEQIMQVADAGLIMPPKATWFEPKLRSGLVIHKLSEE